MLFVREMSGQKLRNLSMVERKRIRGTSWLQAETSPNTLEGLNASVDRLH